MDAAKGFIKLIPTMWGAVSASASWVATMAVGAAQAIAAYATSLGSAIAAQLGLNTAMMANPIGLIVAGVLVLVAAIYLIVKYWDDIKAAIGSFVSFAMEKLSGFWNWIVGTVQSVGAFLWQYHPLRFLLDGIDMIIPGFKAKLLELWNALVGFFMGMWEKIKGIWNGIASLFGSEKKGGKVSIEGPKAETVDPLAKAFGDPGKGDLKLDTSRKKKKSAEDAIGSISGGGKEMKNITVTIQKLVENLNLHTINTQTGMGEMKQMIEETLLRAVQGAELAMGN